MQVCTLLQTDNHTSTPSLCFLQAGCPSCCPTKSVKALKALLWTHDQEMSMIAMPQCYTKLSEGLLWLGSYFLCLVKESTAHVLVSFFSFLLQTGLHVSVRDELHWLCIVQLNVFLLDYVTCQTLITCIVILSLYSWWRKNCSHCIHTEMTVF